MSIRYLLFGAILAGPMFAQTAIPAPSPTTITSSFSFPLVGVANSEGIEVNLINLATNASNGTAASCTGSVTFTTVSGGTVIAGGGSFTLAANAATSIVPTLGNNVVTQANRVLLHAVVENTITPGVPCSLASTLTTFDSATGVTHVLLVGNAPVAVLPITIPGH